jgi:arginyl-tRNA synthetase
MKDVIRHYLHRALSNLVAAGVVHQPLPEVIQVDNTRDNTKGDFSSNVALVMWKGNSQAQGGARSLAMKLVEQMSSDMDCLTSPIFSKIEVAGPGFINFFEDSGHLSHDLDALLKNPNLGVGKTTAVQTVVVDLASPGLAKGMDVGQLRSAIIGDSVANVLTALGDTVIRQNHVGDWGMQFAVLLTYLQENPNEDEQQTDLADVYRKVKVLCDDSDDFSARAQAILVKLQAGDPSCLEHWARLRDMSLSQCQAVYDLLSLNLTPADVRGASAYNEDLSAIVADLTSSGHLIKSDGAQCVFLSKFPFDPNTIILIIEKSGGGYPYATVDLAALRYRSQILKADRVLYYVDERQALHFQGVFTLARQAGFVSENIQLEHLGFGTLNGCDGKAFTTRTGPTIKMLALLVEAQERAYQLVKANHPALAEPELREMARVVGIGTVKYAELARHRTGEYRFNKEMWFRYEGNNALYLLNACAKAVALLPKYEASIEAVEGTMTLKTPLERRLGSKLGQFNEVLNTVGSKGTPHLLCTYLYEVASLFTTFCEVYLIDSANDRDMRTTRLRLTALTARTLQRGLNLLGLEPLEHL